jgi:hypothetical protein
MEVVWFLGIVESLDDPQKLGRVKVRHISEYSNRVDVDDIPWATVLMPITSASLYGVGTSPTGIEIGTRVLGIFLDGTQKTKPMIIGSYPVTLDGSEENHSVSRYARGIGPIKKEYGPLEPKTKYNAKYPNNKTITTKSGHLLEIDDTPKAERIHIYHRSGSYVEFFPDGSIVIKSAFNNTEISNGKKVIAAEKDVNIISNDSEINIIASGDINVVSKDGSINLTAPMVNINA